MLALLLGLSIAADSLTSPVEQIPSRDTSIAVAPHDTTRARATAPVPDSLQIPAKDSIPAKATDSATAATPSLDTAKPTSPMVVPAPASGPIGARLPPPSGPVFSGPVPSGPLGATPVPVSERADTSIHRRSTAAAMGISILLPGAGHTWAGHPAPAPIYHALDILGWAALFVSYQTGRTALSSAAEIANRYAGANLGSDPDPDLLSAMRNYRSRRPEGGRHGSYDEIMVLSGKSTTLEFPDDREHDWDWGPRENPESDAHLRAFESQLRRYRAGQVALYSAAGTLVALRLVAAMDVLRLNRASAARAGLALQTEPIPGGMTTTLAVNF